MTPTFALDLFGVAVFAVSGALAAGRKKMDLFGVLVLAVATAVGGGTLRDLVLGATPVFWVRQPAYLIVATLAALTTVVLARRSRPWPSMLPIADALGLATFTVLGTKHALVAGVEPTVAAVMGVMTGVVGGMIRDVLAGEIPLVLRREIYATASLAGAVLMVGLTVAGTPTASLWAGFTLVLALRLAAIRWRLSLPTFIHSS